MVLIFLLIILLLIVSHFRFSEIAEFKNVVDIAHSFCLQKIPLHTNSSAELKALVCAENFSNLQQSQLYISSGLIHLFVVSGAHLLFIEQSLQKLNDEKKLPFWFIFSVLFIYGLMCNLNPPVTRGLVSLVFSHWLYSKNIRWPYHTKIFLTGLLTLVLCPDWIDSMSLQMSWMAAFTVGIIADLFAENSVLLKQSLFFIVLYPTVMWFQLVSPFTILANIFLAPILEFILFPVAFLTWSFNFFSPLFDILISLFKNLLIFLEFSYQPRNDSSPANLQLINWFILLTLHFSAHVFYVYRRRSSP